MKWHIPRFNLNTVLSFALVLLVVSVYFGFGIEPAAAATLLLMPGVPSVEEAAEELKVEATKLRGLHSEIKEANAELRTKLAEGTVITDSLKASIDEILTKFNGMQASVTDLEQKAARMVENAPSAEKGYGTQLIESEGFKSFKQLGSNPRATLRAEMKAVTSVTGAGLLRQPYQDALVSLPRQRLTIRDLLSVIPVDTASVEYAVQNVRTNAAAPVAESAAKPYSDYGWTTATANVRVIAHLTKITRQAMDDAPRLVAEVDAEMRYGLGLVEEAQILNGNGTGQNLNGIMPQSQDFAAPTGTAGAIPLAQRLDVLRIAMLQVALNLYPTDGIVLHPTDWALIQLTKTNDGAYLLANPTGGMVSPNLWGLPVVDTMAMAQDQFLVGAFKIGANLYQRMGVELLISTENADDFEKNLATMRAEERIGLGVRRPNSFVNGDFSDAIAAIDLPAAP